MRKIITSLFFTSLIFNGFAQGPPVILVWNLENGDYTFTDWSDASPVGTYPAAMILQQYTITGSSVEPDSLANPTEPWLCLYNLTARSRITGRGTEGIGFLNTSDPQNDTQCDGVSDGVSGKKVGAALVNLSSLNREAVTISFKAGIFQQVADTVATPRIFNLRLEARYDTSNAAGWITIPNATYSSAGLQVGNSQDFSNIVLPFEFNNKEIIQVRWKYYQAVEGNGVRPGLLLDDITVTSSVFTSANKVKHTHDLNVYPNPVKDFVFFSSTESGDIYNVIGNKVLSFNNENRLDVSGLPNGAYVIKTTKGLVKKISKQ